ncbi:DMT family transporter [Rothia sp. ZJ932]|uniref:EamA family transporter n=1 Tax=Rothia sp. ZJ932 TaxID=2810516 RepID=UPI001966D348|nr:hypothetical protein [Rothia sp. ZJ932]QRZ60915.1 hypothetical protein JR346_06470 [Rothia sp. ZJ932]
MASILYPKMNMGTQGTGVPLVLLSCLSLQVGAAFAVQLFPLIGAWSVTCLCPCVAALFVCAMARPRVTGWNKTQVSSVILFGVAMGAMNIAFYHAIELFPLGLAVALEFTGPLALAVALSRKKIDAL